MSKKSGPRFKQRRKFNREEAFPKKVLQEKMADEMVLYQHMVVSINRAFPNREERMVYIQALIDGLAVEEDEDEELCGGERDGKRKGRGECSGEVGGAVEVGGCEEESREGQECQG